MSSPQLVEIRQVPPSRLWALVWALLFFALLNAAVWWQFRDAEQGLRLAYDATYQEVMATVERIRADSRPTVVLIGGSVLWGAGHAERETVTARLTAELGEDVGVYSVAMVGARPLDEFVLAWLLRDVADVLVMDYNYEFGVPVEPARFLREPETYLRQRQLFATNATAFLADVPEVEECLARAQVAPAVHESVLEPTIRSAAEAWLPLLRYKHKLNAWLPLLRYKHKLNAWLFGQHPLLLSEKLLRDGGDVLRGTVPLHELLRPPMARMGTAPWQPTDTASEREQIARYTELRFTGEGLLHCLSAAFGTYAAAAQLPLVAYVTPLNPAMFPALTASSLYRENLDTLRQTFALLPLHVPSQALWKGEHFTDSTHLTAAGAAVLAEDLLPLVTQALAR